MDTLHLPIERLAELVDGTPTTAEREHVSICSTCREELAAYQGIVTLASEERRRIGPPLTSWESLSSALRADGLVAPPGASSPASRARTSSRWMRRAAGLAVFAAGGAVLGRLSAGMPLGEAVAVYRTNGAAALAAESTLVPASFAPGGIASLQQAYTQIEQAQRAYEEAAAYLTAHDTASSTDASDQYRTRLAALDQASETFQQALTDAPEDPVLNQYYRATMNARETTIRRLGTTLPVSVRLGRF